jgi:hypothetical protein
MSQINEGNKLLVADIPRMFCLRIYHCTRGNQPMSEAQALMQREITE